MIQFKMHITKFGKEEYHNRLAQSRKILESNWWWCWLSPSRELKMLRGSDKITKENGKYFYNLYYHGDFLKIKVSASFLIYFHKMRSQQMKILDLLIDNAVMIRANEKLKSQNKPLLYNTQELYNNEYSIVIQYFNNEQIKQLINNDINFLKKLNDEFYDNTKSGQAILKMLRRLNGKKDMFNKNISSNTRKKEKQ